MLQPRQTATMTMIGGEGYESTRRTKRSIP